MARERAHRHLHSLYDSMFAGNPIPDFIGNNLDDRHTRILVRSIMLAVFEVAKVTRVLRGIPVCLDELTVL
jgi:acyl carrier protein phosphodiesterase